MNAQDEAEDRRLDWALGEKLGAQTPPDLAMGIIDCHRRGDAARLSQAMATPGRPAPRRWLAAALILLGIGVVVAVALRERPARPDLPSPVAPPLPPPQQPLPVQEAEQLPPAVVVRSKADIEALPAGTRNVEALGLGDEAMVAFARLRELERLAITQEGIGAPQPMPPDGRFPEWVSIGDFSLRHLGKLPKLRILMLRGQGRFTGDGLQHLVGLRLEELACENIADREIPRLARLPHLQRLDLGRNRVDDPIVQGVAACIGLRELSLGGMGSPTTLRPLQQLRHLQVLRLPARPTGAVQFAFHIQGEGRAPEAPVFPQPTGLDQIDALLADLAGLPELRQLFLAGQPVTSAGLAHLGKLPQLEHLDLGHDEKLTDGDLRNLPPTLTSITLRNCPKLTDGVGEVLAGLPRLHTLDLSSCAGLTDAAFAGLLQIHSLQHLDLSNCKGFSESAAAALAAACVPGAIPTTAKLQTLTVRGWQLDGDSLRFLRTLPFLQTLVTDAGTEQIAR